MRHTHTHTRKKDAVENDALSWRYQDIKIIDEKERKKEKEGTDWRRCNLSLKKEGRLICKLNHCKWQTLLIDHRFSLSIPLYLFFLFFSYLRLPRLCCSNSEYGNDDDDDVDDDAVLYVDVYIYVYKQIRRGTNGERENNQSSNGV